MLLKGHQIFEEKDWSGFKFSAQIKLVMSSAMPQSTIKSQIGAIYNLHRPTFIIIISILPLTTGKDRDE
jgi:hypothetical protein